MQDSSSKQQTKQKYKASQHQTGLPLHSACPSEEKQTNKNLSTNLTLDETYIYTGPISGGQKPKGRKNLTFLKERIQLFLKPGKRRPQIQ